MVPLDKWKSRAQGGTACPRLFPVAFFLQKMETRSQASLGHALFAGDSVGACRCVRLFPPPPPPLRDAESLQARGDDPGVGREPWASKAQFTSRYTQRMGSRVIGGAVRDTSG